MALISRILLITFLSTNFIIQKSFANEKDQSIKDKLIQCYTLMVEDEAKLHAEGGN